MCGIIVYSTTEPIQYLEHRGPDETIKVKIEHSNYTFIFHRLAINDLSSNGSQPFISEDTSIIVMCNAEIYNHKELEKEYNITTKSSSDCEVILHLYRKIGFQKTIELIDGEFAIALYDQTNKTLFMARDPIGVRPLFYNTEINAFASEAKALPNSIHTKPFPPQTIYTMQTTTQESLFIRYNSPANLYDTRYSEPFYDIKYSINSDYHIPYEVQEQLKQRFFNAVRKRINNTDRPLGLLLSGGFDSSLVACIAHHLFPDRTFHTFSIGCDDSADLKYARQIANYIKSDHHEIIYKKEDAISMIPEVIKTLETFDITTIRASTPMYILAKYIADNTNVKVVLSGEGADEFGSYKYFYYAPSPHDAAEESKRLFRDIYLFDGLRADRSTAAHGLELRVPFLDLKFFEYMRQLPDVFHCPAAIDHHSTNPIIIEKRNLRYTFKDYLPYDVLWRKKDAFSDSVGVSWRQSLINHADILYSDTEFNEAKLQFQHLPPQTKEALWYRQIFDKHYANAAPNLTPYYWMPKWTLNPTDPSAKVLI